LVIRTVQFGGFFSGLASVHAPDGIAIFTFVVNVLPTKTPALIFPTHWP
jgi:hypothetical protein